MAQQPLPPKDGTGDESSFAFRFFIITVGIMAAGFFGTMLYFMIAK